MTVEFLETSGQAILDLIDNLGRLLAQGNAVLFVGADLRDELGGASIVQRIAETLASRLPESPEDRSLPAVAQAFDTVWGSQALVSALREEIERLGSAVEPLHRLIADVVLPSTKLITTRFDNALEHALAQRGKRFVCIVRDTDVPFFDETQTVIIKLQGDITQPDSLVITEEAIERFIRKLPTISSVVRAYFATKTLVFLGYDLDSRQFQRFFREVADNVGAYRRRAYAITAQPLSGTQCKYWEDRNVEICQQDLPRFLEALAQAVESASQHPQPSNPLQPIAAPPLPAQPYKGLMSFGREDALIFSGRMAESHRLSSAILANRLTVLHGESGSGKSSLLQAGAGHLLAQQRALLAAWTPAPGEVPAQALLDALRQAGAAVGLSSAGSDDLPGTIGRWQALLPGQIILAVDSFEQAFLVYDAAQRAALALLLESLRSDPALDVRIVLVVREDFLGRLQTLEAHLPALLDVRFRVERLQREAARAAIEEPARLFDVHWEETLTAQLLDDLGEESDRGVLPPQLQIVCSRLYEQATRQGSGRITSELLHQLGGVAGILHEYLDREVSAFAPERQRTVWAVLGALVGGSRVKQRLALDDLARRAEVGAEDAAAIVDRLVDRRLVQRYELSGEGARAAVHEVELAHDYLVARIAARLGDAFWSRQRAWETVRQGLQGWQAHGRLLPADDLRLAVQALPEARFTPAEAEMLYTAAVAWRQDAARWETEVPDGRRRALLAGLLEHPDPLVRAEAALRLGPMMAPDVATGLAQVALADSDPRVRGAAAEALAYALEPSSGYPGLSGVERLVAADSDPATHQAARAALVAVRDRQPASGRLLPTPLRFAVQRAVWWQRWQRHRGDILSRTLQGFQGGFWGLGLSLGLLLFPLFELSRGRLPQEVAGDRGYLLWLTLGMVPLVGLIGGAAGGTAAFVWAALAGLGDRPRAWRVWAAATLASAGVMALGFVVLSLVSLGNPRWLNAWAAGLLVGLALTGAATLPVRWGRPARLAVAVVISMAAFAALGPLYPMQFKPGQQIHETLSDGLGATARPVIQVEPYTPLDGSPAIAGLVRPVVRAGPLGPSTWLEAQHAQLRFEFRPALERLTTCIASTSEEPLRVQVNGQAVGIGESGDIAVSLDSCPLGTLVVVTGPIETFAVGGDAWAMDSLCPDFPDPVRDCIEFDALRPRWALLSDQFETWQWVVVGVVCGLGFFLGLNRRRDSWRWEGSPADVDPGPRSVSPS